MLPITLKVKVTPRFRHISIGACMSIKSLSLKATQPY